MFEHYITYQKADPKRRKQITVASIISGTATFSMILFAWAANKMDIRKVDPPTIDYIMVQMSVDEAPPPPPPPPPPAGDDSEPEEEEEIPEEEVPEEEIVQPKETPDKVPDAKKVASNKPAIPGGIPGGVSGGVPGGVVGGVLGGQLGGQLGGVATKRDAATRSVPKPISSVMAQGIFTPDPDQKKLQSTKAGMFDKRPGSNQTAFCVEKDGKTTDVQTKKRFPGDPQVDAICRDTVKKWRFKPFVVAGRAEKTCTVVTFNLSFK